MRSTPGLMPSANRICLFGGTFDPIHCAHLRVAEEAARSFGLDQVLFIPAHTPPHKTNRAITPYEDRLGMVAIACEPYPLFWASDLEGGAGRNYTIDTVRKFQTRLGSDAELYFLIGADAFDEIESWKEWQELIRLITFIVVTRPGGHYRIPEHASVLPLNGLDLPVSSSAIRARLADGEQTPELPTAVRAYIDAHGLYREAESTALR